MTNHLKLLMATSLAFSLTTIYGDSSAMQEDSSVEKKTYRSSDVFLSSPDYTVALDFSALCLQPSSSNLHYIAEALPLSVPTPN